MGPDVFANGRGIAHGGSQGLSMVFPDVCQTPSPAGPIPIPYPNIARSADTADGPKSVKIKGNMPAVEDANYSTSTGDEAGSAGGGVMSGSTKGKAEFITSSFDVKFEGKNVCRLGDMMFHNKKNGMG